MEEAEKEWVRDHLNEVARTRCGGRVRRENVQTITKDRTLSRRFQKHAADTAWSWIAETKNLTEPTEHSVQVDARLHRMSPGATDEFGSPIPRWEWYATVISGWDRPETVKMETVTQMRLTDQVLTTLIREEEGMGWPKWEAQERVLTLSKGTVARAWSKVKSAFKGEGGYSRYLSRISMLMIEGQVEGGMGPQPGNERDDDPREAQWWQEAVEMSIAVHGRDAVSQVTLWEPPAPPWRWLRNKEEETATGETVSEDEDQESGPTVDTVEVVVDWMACTQSLRRAVEDSAHLTGYEYIGLDIQEWVYSVAMRGWVKNVQIDLSRATPKQVREAIVAEMTDRMGLEPHSGVKIVVKLLAMSPCCRTYSKADSSNSGRGNNYRLHGKADKDGTRPPKDSTSMKGKMAHEADRMVQRGIQLTSYLANSQSSDMSLYMENPVGSLARRGFMRDWTESGKVIKETVHYCAYDHCYHKPTNIWTNMKWWRPKGRTGTGRCEEKCQTGYRNHTGKWAHEFKIAQASHKAAGGLGRKARKNMMPYWLHMELIHAADTNPF